ncbi:dipeptide/oligopeptide/nickel ABC transporter ATP-binding protein [Pseudomonadota bacterium]
MSATQLNERATTLLVKDLRVSARINAGEKEILSGISLELFGGEAVAIVGESGAGKTMLARAIVGILPKGIEITRGTIDAERTTGHRAAFTMVPQNPKASLPPLMTVGKLLDAVAKWNGISDKEERTKLSSNLFELVSLKESEVCGLRPHQLSGGMAQRVAFAAALATRPSGLVLDEPTSSLDPILRDELINLIIDLRKNSDFTLLAITHDPGFSAAICDRYLLLKSGRIITSSTFETTPEQHNEYVERWFSK